MKEIFRWENLYTGAIYHTFCEALIASFTDMVHYPKCRTWKIFMLGRL